MAQHLPIDWVIVRDVVSVLFTGLGALFFRKTERSRRINNETIDRLNGHVDAVDQMQEDIAKASEDIARTATNILKMRRHMAEQSRRIQSLETNREHAAILRKQLEDRIEALETRGS